MAPEQFRQMICNLHINVDGENNDTNTDLTAISQTTLVSHQTPFSILSELRMMEALRTTRAIQDMQRCSQVVTNTQLFTGWMPILSPDEQHQSTEEKKYHIPHSPQVLQGMFYL